MSDASMLAMVVRILETRGKSVTVQKIGSSAADEDKPWHGGTTQTVSDEVDTQAMFLPATGRGLGKLIDQNALSNELSEFAVIQPPATGEDLRTYHQIDDSGVSKRVEKWWILQPASTVVAFVAGIAK